MVTTLPVPASQTEVVKRQQLIANRRWATGLLGFATLVFIATVIDGSEGWVGYVRATAEASMVGGLADWFAVTALFRHPLGIPIPHTNIIPERKDQFGETLGTFVQTSLLTPEAIVERVRNADIAPRAAAWLADPPNAERLAAHGVDAAVALADVLRDEDVQQVVERAVRERVDRVELAPIAGRILERLTAEGRHHELFDAALRGLEHFLDERREDLRHRFGQESPWWLPGAVEDRIFDRLLDGFRALLRNAAHDPDHELRTQLDQRLRQFAQDLQTTPELRERGEQLKQELLSQPELRRWIDSLWCDAKEWLREEAGNPDGQLRRGLAGAIAAGGAQLRDEPVLLERAQEAIESGARYVAEHFHGEIAALVKTTISRWDGRQTSDRLELLLGPDLQFIRINGTVVGALAGLLLYSISEALG